MADKMLYEMGHWPTLADPMMWMIMGVIILYGILVVIEYYQDSWFDTEGVWLRRANTLWCVIVVWLIVLWMGYNGLLAHLVVGLITGGAIYG